MHELGITQQVVEAITARAGDARITRVVLEIGKLSAVLPDAVRFCFDLVAEGTAAEGATLEIVEPAGVGRCRACGAEVRMERPFARCACGCSELDWLSGESLLIREITLRPTDLSRVP